MAQTTWEGPLASGTGTVRLGSGAAGEPPVTWAGAASRRPASVSRLHGSAARHAPGGRPPVLGRCRSVPRYPRRVHGTRLAGRIGPGTSSRALFHPACTKPAHGHHARGLYLAMCWMKEETCQERPPPAWRSPLTAGIVLSLSSRRPGQDSRRRHCSGDSLSEPGTMRQYGIILGAESGVAAARAVTPCAGARAGRTTGPDRRSTEESHHEQSGRPAHHGGL